MASFLHNIYTCDVDSWPVESLAHKFWHLFNSHHNNSVDYVHCLQRHNLTLESCYNHTAPHCGERFGERSPERLAECQQLLWKESFLARHPNVSTRRQFQLYRNCCAKVRRKVAVVVFLSPLKICYSFLMEILQNSHAVQNRPCRSLCALWTSRLPCLNYVLVTYLL